jgi:hypothetical protein
MFYYIEMHFLAHYIQRIKMHAETVKNIRNICLFRKTILKNLKLFQ